MSEILSLLKDLTSLSAPSGYEHEVREYVLKKVKPYADSVSVDKSGNVLAEFKANDVNAPTVIFAAHMDEVAFMVFDISDNGFLYLHPIGGWNTITLPSSSIEIISETGQKYTGVFGQISPHFLKKGTKPDVPDFDDLFVDIGATSRDEVLNEYHISQGCIAIPKSYFYHNPKSNTCIGKAFDDRVGCAVQIMMAELIQKEKLLWNVVLAFTVQEEVGHRGAKVIANYTNADAAIIIEGAPADDIPAGPRHPQTCVGKGVHVRIFDPSHIGNPLLLEKIKKLIKTENIRAQYAVRKGGGTDADALALAFSGIPAIITGVPTRYAHSHQSLISLDDVAENIKLCLQFVTNG